MSDLIKSDAWTYEYKNYHLFNAGGDAGIDWGCKAYNVLDDEYNILLTAPSLGDAVEYVDELMDNEANEYVVVGFDTITGVQDIVMWQGFATSEADAITIAKSDPDNIFVEVNDIIEM